jgi:hypothetical protein
MNIFLNPSNPVPNFRNKNQSLSMFVVIYIRRTIWKKSKGILISSHICVSFLRDKTLYYFL